MPSTRWEWVGGQNPRSLAEARLVCHHALQLLTHSARGYLAEQADDSHTSVTWNHELRALQGRLIESAAPPFAMALRPQDLTIMVLGPACLVESQLPLDGLRFSLAAEWLQDLLRVRGLDPTAFARPLHFEVSTHPVATGAPFDASHREELEEIARYYANAALVLEGAAEREPAATPVRCWPHHFDIATLITVSEEAGRTIGYGFSPGDGSYPQPYFYISPWPYPDASKLSRLPAVGRWHTEGWTGAVLLAEDLVAVPRAEAQYQAVENFSNQVLPVLRELLQTP